MEQSVLDPLSEITQALKMGKVRDKWARTYLAMCIDNLLHLTVSMESEIQDVLHKYLPVIEQLISILPDDNADTLYYHSIAVLIQSDYQGYLMETESFYAAKSTEVPDWLDWTMANQYFVSIWADFPVLGDWDEQIEERLVRAHQKYAAKYFPKSAFDRYCKFWVSKGSDQYRLRLLRDVLEKDHQWTWVWVEIGDIYYNQKKWVQALDAYQRAIVDKRTHFDDLFFAGAWAAEQIKNWDIAIGYYQRCIDLNPAYPYAQNNLGCNLNRQKRYVEAEPYLRYAVVHDEDKKNPCRNLFNSLEKLEKTEELCELIMQYPEQFRTKYYRERLGKIGGKEKLVNMEELQKLLQRTTDNEYAGTITVSPEQSGIRLYEHQKQAVEKLNKWKLRGDGGAGLLVLPTGGGKTLTATYWLMKNILDRGGKVLWIAHRHELLNQACHAFKRVCFHDLSPHKREYRYRIISGQHDKAVHIRPEDDILIASKGSLAHELSHVPSAHCICKPSSRSIHCSLHNAL